jgi:hypothetical protein
MPIRSARSISSLAWDVPLPVLRVGSDGDDRRERVDEIARIDGARAPGALPGEGINRP